MTTTTPGPPWAATGPAPSGATARPGRWSQSTIDDLGTPLHEVVFVVVDLETTGGSAAECGITEIGAVKVRAGEVLGEFATLVDPGRPIPPTISALTGITDAMVATAPPIESVLPSFLEFARGAVLVAHNAGFDVSFLKAAAARCGVPWPGFTVLDTVRLARYALARDEVRNHKLSTLAAHVHARVAPTHRAFDDARATVDVLHALLARVGNHGVTSLEDLTTFTSRVTLAQRRKRHLAEAVPHAPGVYVFHGPGDEVLYVGTSRDLRSRVRSYFTASETRSRIAEMVQLATRVRPIVCATTLEAQVRELRLIAEHDPPYNRRSRRPERAPWVKLTVEPFPRLSIVRTVRDDVHQGATYLGPFRTHAAAEQAVAALHEAFALRRCSPRLPATPAADARACVLAEIGRCGAPCTGEQPREEYAELVERARAAITRDAAPLADHLLARIRTLSEQERFEDAATARDRLRAFVRGAVRTQRLEPLATTPELVAARRDPQEGGWEIVVVRHGRLAGTARSPRGADPMPYVEAVRLQGEVVRPAPGPAPAAHPEETEIVLRWLEQPGVRLVHLEGTWSCPAGGAGSVQARLEGLPEQSPAGFERPLGLRGRVPVA